MFYPGYSETSHFLTHFMKRHRRNGLLMLLSSAIGQAVIRMTDYGLRRASF